MSTARLVAIDTEFHREKSYFAKLALVQIAADDEVFLIDPLRVDISGLRALFESDTEVIFHAAAQDLEILRRKVGVTPAKIFDTQVAAGFLGYSSASLASLLEVFLGVTLDKSDRLSDWMVRPLEAKQLHYAAQDVIYLAALREALMAELEKLGRTAWLEEEMKSWVSQEFYAGTDPDRAWSKIREVRSLKGRSKHVAMALAAWREAKAIEADLPVRFVLADLAIATIAQAAPRRASDLRNVRGVDARHLGGGSDNEIIKVIAHALDSKPIPDEQRTTPDSIDVPSGTATLLVTWLASRARSLRIDPALLGSRSDINEIYGGVQGAKLALGWRKEAVGNYIERIISGEIALALASNGDVTMVQNNHVAIA